MPSLLQFLYRETDHPDAGSLIDFDKARNEFSVSWVVHRYETLPVTIEHCVGEDLYQIVESCRARLPEMRDKYPNTPPDGFLVFNGAGCEMRRWFESARPPLLMAQRKQEPGPPMDLASPTQSSGDASVAR
jgi:hypothetical protein